MYAVKNPQDNTQPSLASEVTGTELIAGDLTASLRVCEGNRRAKGAAARLTMTSFRRDLLIERETLRCNKREV